MTFTFSNYLAAVESELGRRLTVAEQGELAVMFRVPVPSRQAAATIGSSRH